MIRKRTRPVRVCIGNRKLRNEAKALFKETFLKPDAKRVEQWPITNPKTYKVIPLHKHIHIVSAAEIHARRERQRLQKLQEENCSQQVQFSPTKVQERTKVNEYFSSIGQETSTKKMAGDDDPKSNMKKDQNVGQECKKVEMKESLMKNMPAFYCVNNEMSSCGQNEAKSEKRKYKNEYDDEANRKESSKKRDEDVMMQLKRKEKKKRKKEREERKRKEKEKKEKAEGENENGEEKKTKEKKKTDIEVERGRSIKTKVKINFHDKNLKPFKDFKFSFDTD